MEVLVSDLIRLPGTRLDSLFSCFFALGSYPAVPCERYLLDRLSSGNFSMRFLWDPSLP